MNTKSKYWMIPTQSVIFNKVSFEKELTKDEAIVAFAHYQFEPVIHDEESVWWEILYEYDGRKIEMYQG